MISLVKEKERVRKRFVKNGRDKASDDYKTFCVLRSDVKAMQKSCHASYVKRVSEGIKDNPKRFWSYVKTLKKSPSIPDIITFNGCEHSSLRDIAQAFCKYFESVFIVHDEHVLPDSTIQDV